MKLLAAILPLMTLWGHFSEARSCRDEPERCPVLRWICNQPVAVNAQNYMYLSATITSSLFSGDSLSVKERFCYRSPQLSCREQNSQGKWQLFPGDPKGHLVNILNGQKILVHCTKHNGGIL